MQSLPTPTKSESWGGNGGDAMDINEKPWRLTSLTVSYKGLIDAFSFSYIDQAGKKQSVGPWGEGYHSDIIKRCVHLLSHGTWSNFVAL